MDAVTNQPQVAQAGGHHHHHHHGGGGQAQAVNDAVSKALGMSADDLRTARSQGTSLAQLAASKGISQDDLTKAIEQGLQQSDPSIGASRANQIASALISSQKPDHGAAGGDRTSATGEVDILA
jgi:hypothetical protein